MTPRFRFALVALLVLCVPAGVFAGSPSDDARNTSQTEMFGPSVSVSGCITSGTGNAQCQASAFGGSGQYNYWWTWDGPGNLYQTNSANVDINGCLDGEGDLRVQVRDRVTGQLSQQSAPYTLTCDCSPGNPACDPPSGDDPCWPGLGFCPPGGLGFLIEF